MIHTDIGWGLITEYSAYLVDFRGDFVSSIPQNSPWKP